MYNPGQVKKLLEEKKVELEIRLGQKSNPDYVAGFEPEDRPLYQNMNGQDQYSDRRRLEDIKEILKKISNNAFEICPRCGEKIPEERLSSTPTLFCLVPVLYCLPCQLEIENEEKRYFGFTNQRKRRYRGRPRTNYLIY